MTIRYVAGGAATGGRGWLSTMRLCFINQVRPMPTRTTSFLLTLLFSAPLLALGQDAGNIKSATKVVDFTNKTFRIGEDKEASKADIDLQLLLLFYKDGRATFRAKRGDYTPTWLGYLYLAPQAYPLLPANHPTRSVHIVKATNSLLIKSIEIRKASILRTSKVC